MEAGEPRHTQLIQRTLRRLKWASEQRALNAKLRAQNLSSTTGSLAQTALLPAFMREASAGRPHWGDATSSASLCV